jgi:dihydroxyacid dehydratase/phosphogluconate dehydratase
LLEKDKARDIMTRKAFENAITMVVVWFTQCAVMHLIMVHAVDIEIT